MSTPEEDAAPVAAITRRGSWRWWAGLAILFGVIAAGVSAVHLRELPPENLPVRFQVPPPEGTKFGGSAMALSPDGRQLAFNAINQQGRQLLWVRALDSLVAREIPGTEGAVLLFWSPDNRSVGFYSGGKLKRVDVGGPYGSGPVQTVTNTTGGGASWNRDGAIIFGNPTNGLFRVAQAGGVPALVIKPEEFFTGSEAASLRPWFLPDGNHFLYFALGQHGLEDSGTYLASLDGKRRKRLTLSTQSGLYAPPAPPAKTGHLLYLRDTTLLAQPLDSGSFNPVGEPIPVAEQVGHNRANGLFSVSNNGVLAYRVGGSVMQLTWFDRQGKTLGTVGRPETTPTWRCLPLASEWPPAIGRRVTGTSALWT